MAKGKNLETSVSLTGSVEKGIIKQLENLAENADQLEKAAAAAAGPVGNLLEEISRNEKALKKAQIQYAGYVLKNEKSSDAAKALKQEIKRLSREIENGNQALEDAEDAASKAAGGMSRVERAASNAKGGFTVMKGVAVNLATKGLEFLASKALDAFNAIWNLAEETQEYREDIGKLETAWEAAGKSTELATDTYKQFYSALGEEDRSVEAVNHLAKFVDTEEDMAKWTDIAMGVWGTFGDSLPIEGLTEAANETAKVGKVTGPLADALNWAGVNEDEFNAKLAKYSKESDRAALITETLNGLYEDAADKYQENNKSVIDARLATSDLTDAQAELGEKMEPIKTEFTKFKTEALQALMPYLLKVAESFLWVAQVVLPKLIDAIDAGINAIKGIINFVKNVFSIEWANVWQQVVNVFGKIFGSMAGVVKMPINAVISIINGAISRINSIGFDVPDWVPIIGGKDFSVNIPQIPMLATGGFTDGVSIAGEKGTEAVISFDPAYRKQNLGYWAQAGQMLGAKADSLPLSSGTTSSTVNFGGITFAPVIQTGNNANGDDIIKAIKSQYPEFLDMLDKWYNEREEYEYV